MVQMKFVGMLLGLLFIMNALRDYYAFAHNDVEVGSNNDQLADTTSAQNRHKELGGRKMVMMKKKEGYNGANYAWPNHDHKVNPSSALNDDDEKNSAAAHYKKERYRWKAMTAAAKEDEDDEEEESKRLMEETRKIVALMHRDYKGMNKPRRKPPINNHLPVH